MSHIQLSLERAGTFVAVKVNSVPEGFLPSIAAIPGYNYNCSGLSIITEIHGGKRLEIYNKREEADRGNIRDND